MSGARIFAVALVALGVIGPALFAKSPVAVSPGDVSKLALIDDRCPTFSWGAVQGAQSYELVVYRLGDDGEEAREVLRQSFPGSVDGWTPALDSCLERGGRYGWSVRAVGGRKVSEWSAPSLFAVAPGPSAMEFAAALEVVREYLGEETKGSSGATAGAESSPGAAAGIAVAGAPEVAGAGPTPRSLVAGDSGIEVNGSPVLTVATSRNLLLCANRNRGGWRYWDLGDGTVLDCNTGLVWLRNANCFGGKAWNAAQSDAASLADGACGLTDGSSAGDWRQPTISEFCSAWEGSVLAACPASAAPDSLVNTNFSSPTVSNASGDGQWAANDAFAGVEPLFWWSATENGGAAWFVRLDTGGVATWPTNNALFFVWPVRGGQ